MNSSTIGRFVGALRLFVLAALFTTVTGPVVAASQPVLHWSGFAYPSAASTADSLPCDPASSPSCSVLMAGGEASREFVQRFTKKVEGLSTGEAGFTAGRIEARGISYAVTIAITHEDLIVQMVDGVAMRRLTIFSNVLVYMHEQVSADKAITTLIQSIPVNAAFAYTGGDPVESIARVLIAGPTSGSTHLEALWLKALSEKISFRKLERDRASTMSRVRIAPIALNEQACFASESVRNQFKAFVRATLTSSLYEEANIAVIPAADEGTDNRLANQLALRFADRSLVLLLPAALYDLTFKVFPYQKESHAVDGQNYSSYITALAVGLMADQRPVVEPTTFGSFRVLRRVPGVTLDDCDEFRKLLSQLMYDMPRQIKAEDGRWLRESTNNASAAAAALRKLRGTIGKT